MSLRPNSPGDCVSAEQTLRKRTKSVTDAYSAKRRRISLASVDLARELQDIPGSSSELGPGTSADRFIPSRPKQFLPLNSTPRTNRIAHSFGLTDSRLLSYTDDRDTTSAVEEPQMHTLLRRSASALLHTPKPLHPTSVSQNLANRKQCLLALDGPGMSHDPFAYPVTWSKKNLLAVACGNDVYYQNLNNRSIEHFGRLTAPMCGRLHAIEWAEHARREGALAAASTTGVVQIWYAGSGIGGRAGRNITIDGPFCGVGAMCWNEDVLAVGKNDGSIALFDDREGEMRTLKMSRHNGKIMGVKWSADGCYVASGDNHGRVFIWDSRAAKWLGDGGTKGSKMRHRGPVKALAWCPWKSDLLATGSTYPEGKIRIWSSSSSFSSPGALKPLHTMSLNTSVLSLHWSPHCKELLSTHGSSFEPPQAPSSGTQTPNVADPLQGFTPIPSPLTNSIAVHAYPSCKRLLSLTHAHMGAVGHSCLGPDGTKVFTVCPREEAMKMWQVWAKREDVERRESVFDMCAIR